MGPANLFRPGHLTRQRAILEDAFDLVGPHVVMAHAKDVVESDNRIHHVAAGTGQLNYSFYLSLLRDLSVPLLVHGLSELELPWSLAFLRATLNTSDQRRLLRAGVS